MANYLIDTNVLLRSVDASSVQCDVARSAISNLLTQGHLLQITPQNLIEFWAVATRPINRNGLGYSRETALAEVEKLQRFFPLAEDRPEVFERWSDLIRRYTILGKRAHDARLASVAVAHGMDFIRTFNIEDFRSLGVAAVDPKTLA